MKEVSDIMELSLPNLQFINSVKIRVSWSQVFVSKKFHENFLSDGNWHIVSSGFRDIIN